MNTFLWVIAIALAVGFVSAGLLHLLAPKKKLDAALGWPTDLSAGAVRFIGMMEILGAAGLVLPAALDVATILTPLAAVGLALVMVGAMNMHYRRHEPANIVFNVVLLALAVFVAWGRFGQHSF